MHNVIPFKEPAKQEPVCSFRKKQKAHVKKLIATCNGLHHICNECINHATERLKQDEPK